MHPEAQAAASGGGAGSGRGELQPKQTHTLCTTKGFTLSPSFLCLQQISKMTELAKEKQAAELKTLKETSERYGCLTPTPDSYLPRGLRPPQNFSLMPVSLK